MPLDPVLGGAIAGGIANIAGAAIGNIGSKKRQERADKINLKNWRLQNEYNSPTAQMARLREAGLNPNLVYGGSSGGTAGTASPVAKSDTPEYRSPNLNLSQDIGRFAQLAIQKQQANLLENQNTTEEQKGILLAEQAVGQDLANRKTAIDLGIHPELAATSLQVKQQTVRQLEAQTIGRQLDNMLKDQSLKPTIMRLYYEVQYAKENLIGQQLSQQLQRFEISLNKLGLTKGDALWSRIMGKNAPDIKAQFKKGKSPSPKIDYFQKRNQGTKKFGLTPKY